MVILFSGRARNNLLFHQQQRRSHCRLHLSPDDDDADDDSGNRLLRRVVRRQDTINYSSFYACKKLFICSLFFLEGRKRQFLFIRFYLLFSFYFLFCFVFNIAVCWDTTGIFYLDSLVASRAPRRKFEFGLLFGAE